MRIYQLTNGMMYGDAISNHVLEIDARLRAWGHTTAIFSGYVAPEMEGKVRPDKDYVAHLNDADSLLIFHYSVYNPNVRLFQTTRARRLLIYHNITPARFFYKWDTGIAAQCDIGRQILRQLADCEFALGDSDFNRQELIAAGFSPEKTGVLPIFLTTDFFESCAPDPGLKSSLRESGDVNWLTVGRVVPNKALEDVIRVFYIYNQYINPASKLYIVGSQYVKFYVEQLKVLVADLGLHDQVVFTGRVSDADLVAYYQAADLYLCASYHEGFCVPLIESMYFGVPVLARKSTAVPETLGHAGVLFTELGYEAVAEMAHLLVEDQALRQRVIARQKARLDELSPQRAEAALKFALSHFGI
ncbi:MAG: glycosyltransferase [Anaerolineae bacterium]|nr:glycosyltransferase [Anaerolineae bacterium]